MVKTLVGWLVGWLGHVLYGLIFTQVLDREVLACIVESHKLDAVTSSLWSCKAPVARLDPFMAGMEVQEQILSL